MLIEQGLDAANRCTKALYQMSTESLAQLSQRELEDVFTNTSTHKLFLDPGMTIYDVAMAIKLFERGGIMRSMSVFPLRLNYFYLSS